jgi:hypothetical protein
LVRMRSQIEESIEEFDRKIDVATHSNQSVIKGYAKHNLNQFLEFYFSEIY